MWIFGGFKGAERVYVECTAGCPNEAARRAHWVPPADFVAGGRLRAAAAATGRGGDGSWRRRVVAAAGLGGAADALARFSAVHVRQRLGTDGINVSLLRGFKVLTVYMVGTDCYAPMGPPDGGGRSWRWRIGDRRPSVGSLGILASKLGARWQ